MFRTSTAGLFTLVALLFLACSSWAAAADQMTSSVLIGDARVDATIEQSTLHMPTKDIFRWVKSAAESVTVYYGRFPVPQVSIWICPFEGNGIRHGMAFADQGGRITIHVGNQTSPAEFASDWMLTHEMVHLAFPSVDNQHHWIEEGIATYVEPIARIRAGHFTAEQMWLDLMRDMPQGLPHDGDKGLDRTHTWGRTYWGGALFCLLADIEIRRQTNNAKGLEQALRGILEAGGDIRQHWDLPKTLRTGDRAAGVNVLFPLYEKMKNKPVAVDLGNLWKELGIQPDRTGVRFDNGAGLAAIRRTITGGESDGATSRCSPPRPHTVSAGFIVRSK
jgi:hypothetical protein